MTAPDPRPDLTRRLHKLTELGGLPLVGVRNDEWFYLLQEETRQSLSIEGYVATDSELKAVLSGRRSGPEILNSFRAAQGLYDLALQYHRENELVINLPLIRHIHSELSRELDVRRGLLRSGGIQISGAKVRPPEHDLEAYMRAWLALVPSAFQQGSVLDALARLHVLFEAMGARAGLFSIIWPSVWAGRPSSKAPRPVTGSATTPRWKREIRAFMRVFLRPAAPLWNKR